MAATDTTATITVLVTDLVGSTELLRHGPEAFDELRRAHLDTVRRAVGDHRGVEVKSTGDGILATFTSAADAVSCAVAVQIAVATLQRRDKRQPAVRVGVSTGEATSEDGDWYGPPVIEAARLCAAADGGQILAASVVATLVGARGGHRFVPKGDLLLKGFDAPTAVVEVGWAPPDVSTPLSPAAELAGSGPVVGRDDELRALADRWKAVQPGRRGAVLASGEPGVGKTRLVGELAARSHAEGATVLWGRCDEDIAVPYQPFAEAARHWLATAPESLVRELGPDLERLLSGTAGNDGSPTAMFDADAERHRLFADVSRFLARLAADAPVVVVLDDLHWATEPTLLLLRHVIRDPDPSAVLVIGTYRDTDLDRTHPLSRVLADLRREPNTERISLGGLTAPAVTQFLEAVSGQEIDEAGAHLASAIHAETEGNPFFVRQVLQHLIETGAVKATDGRWSASVPLDELGLPEGVREVVGRRLSALSPAANRALAVAALAGHEFDLATIEAVVDVVPAGEVLDALEEAVAAHLVHEVGERPGTFAFDHALVRQTLAAELTAARRARIHRRIGETLARRPSIDPAQCAHHFIEGATAGAVQEAVDWALLAIGLLSQRLALEEAAALADRALQVLDLTDEPTDLARGRLLAQKAMQVQFLGATGEAKALADDAATAARRADDPIGLADAAIARTTWGRAGVDDPEAGALVDLALDRLGGRDPARRIRLLLARAIWRAVNRSEGRAGEDDAVAALDIARETGDPRLVMSAASTRALVLQGGADLDHQLAALADVLDAAERLPTGTREFHRIDIARVEIVVAMQRGDREGVERAIARADFGTPGDVDLRLPVGMRSMWIAMLAAAEGRFDDAERASAALLEVENDDNFANSWAALAFHIARERGTAAALVPVVEEAAAATPGLTALRCLLAEAYVDAGRDDDAVALLADLRADRFAGLPRDSTFSAALSQLTEVVAALGDRDAASAISALLLPYAGQLVVVSWGVYCPGAADRYLAMCDTVLGRHDHADHRFASAVALEESMGGTPLAARTRYWWALDRHAAGDDDRATQLAGEAHDAASRLGMTALADAAAGLRRDRGG